MIFNVIGVLDNIKLVLSLKGFVFLYELIVSLEILNLLFGKYVFIIDIVD